MSSILEALKKLEADKAAKNAAEGGVRVFEPQSAKMELLADSPDDTPRDGRRFSALWIGVGVLVVLLFTVVSSVVSILVIRSMTAVPAVAVTPKIENPAAPAPEPKMETASVPKAPEKAVTPAVEPVPPPAPVVEAPAPAPAKPEKETAPTPKPEAVPKETVEEKTPDPVVLPPLPEKVPAVTKPVEKKEEREAAPKPKAPKKTENLEPATEPDAPIETAKAPEATDPPATSRRENPRFPISKAPSIGTPMANPAKATPDANAPVNLDTLPVLRGGDLGRYGLENMHINVLREAGPDRPYAVAIINLASVYVGDMVPGTQAKLIGVRRNGIGIQDTGTGERFFIEQ